jgi:hypothetical protein
MISFVADWSQDRMNNNQSTTICFGELTPAMDTILTLIGSLTIGLKINSPGAGLQGASIPVTNGANLPYWFLIKMGISPGRRVKVMIIAT